MGIFGKKGKLLTDIWQIESIKPSVERIIVFDAEPYDIIRKSSLYGAVIPFDASFCLWCAGEYHLYSKIVHHQSKLGKASFFGRSEDGMLVRVERHGNSVFCQNIMHDIAVAKLTFGGHETAGKRFSGGIVHSQM